MKNRKFKRNEGGFKKEVKMKKENRKRKEGGSKKRRNRGRAF